MSIKLSGRQRDFLASFPDEIEVALLEQAEDGSVFIHANGGLQEVDRDLWVPREGFLMQPHVELHDPEHLLTNLPELSPAEDAARKMAGVMGEYSRKAWGHFVETVMTEHPQADVNWPKVAKHLRRGLQAQPEG